MTTSQWFTHPRTLLVTAITAFSLAASITSPPRADAGRDHDIVVPRMPDNLKVPAGNKVFLEGHALGTQNYICMPCPNAITPVTKCPASGFAWAFFGPQATLFDVDSGDDSQIITHFNSSNPIEDGKERPTWQHSHDTSIVWANNTFPPAEMSLDPHFVADRAIAWLRLPMAGTQVGPAGGDKLANTTFVQRLETQGGVAPPADTCASPADSGHKAFVPYTANYFFYRKAK